MTFKTLAALVGTCAALSLTGCAAQKTLVPTSGSKADGTVVMTYNYGRFEKPVIDMDQALKSATKRCQAWGYQEADPFGGSTHRCIASDGWGGCSQTQVDVTYQCLD